MTLNFSDPATGWSFECPDSSGKPYTGGLTLKNIRHHSNNFARDIRLIGIRLRVSDFDNTGQPSIPKNVFVSLDPPNFKSTEIQELRPSALAAPQTAAERASLTTSSFMDRLKNASDKLLSLGSYFKDASGNYNGYGVRADYTADPTLFSQWPNCEVSGLTIGQTFLFSTYGMSPPHEPGSVLMAARCHPLTTYKFTLNSSVQQWSPIRQILSIRFDYRLYFALDAVPNSPSGGLAQRAQPWPNNAGLFRDNDTLAVGSLLSAAAASFVDPALASSANSAAAFAAVEKQLILEVAAPGQRLGLSKQGSVTCWDNIHWWGNRGSGPMISAPGAFHAAHMHWRWGSAGSSIPHGRAAFPGDTSGRPSGLTGVGTGGSLLVDPRIWVQSIDVAVAKDDPSRDPEGYGVIRESLSKEDWKTLFTSRAAADISAGANIVCWYSVEVQFPRSSSQLPQLSVPQQLEGTVFVHGIFFAHNAEQTGLTIGDTRPQHWPRNEGSIRSSGQWVRDAS